MANITIVNTTNSIKVDFGTLPVGFTKGAWCKRAISSVVKFPTYIEVVANNSDTWKVSHDGASGSLQIDTIDGVAPTDLDDLYTKLIALIA